MPAIEKIEQLAEEFKLIRQDFHRHPEVGHQESQTAAKISQFLKNWGYEVHPGIGGTGVVGILKNGSSEIRHPAEKDGKSPHRCLGPNLGEPSLLKLAENK